METMDKLATALAKAQADITSPARNREVEVRTKTGGTYKFKYATLDAIIDHIRKPLTANGLWFTQTLENGDGKYRLVTTLLHSSGQALRSETPLLVQGQGNQDFGSALTYMRRYALTAMLGIAADEDDDGNAADGNEVKSSVPREAKGSTANATWKTVAGAAVEPMKPKDTWTGPLKVTALKDEMRTLISSVQKADDDRRLLELTDEYAAVLEQCKYDLPDWHDRAMEVMNATRSQIQQAALLAAG